MHRVSQPIFPQFRAARKHAAPIPWNASESEDDEASTRSDARDFEDDDFDEDWEEEVKKTKRAMKERGSTTRLSLDATSASAPLIYSDQSTRSVSEADISQYVDPEPSHCTRTASASAKSILKRATSKRQRDQDDKEPESYNGSTVPQRKKFRVSFVEPELTRELFSVSNVPPEPKILCTKGLSEPLCNSIRSEASVEDVAQGNALEDVALPVGPRVSNDRVALMTRLIVPEDHHIQVGHIPRPSDVDPALYDPRIHASYQTRRNIVDELNKDMEPMKDAFMRLMFDKAKFQDRVDQVLKRRSKEWNLD
ncbi:hypothetical protein LTR66_001732 [Elasticomyces elasticus]|nr:hypothetical protein LTR66_001732 [Elasticomyces elasticus]